MLKKRPLQTSKVNRILVGKPDLQVHLATFSAENIPKRWPFNTRKIAKDPKDMTLSNVISG